MAGLQICQKLVASIPGQYIRSRHWKQPQQSLLVFGYLRRLAASFEGLEMQHASSSGCRILKEGELSIPSLLSRLSYSVCDDATARTVCLFFTDVCLLLWNVLTTTPAGTELLDRFCAFFRELKARFSHLDCFQSCMLSLMAVASPASAEKLKELRSLNGTMSLEETLNRAVKLAEATPQVLLARDDLLRCGLALQACLDVESGVSCSQLPVTGLLCVAGFLLPLCRLPLYLERFVGLVNSIGRFDNGTLDAPAVAKLVSGIVKVEDGKEKWDPDDTLRQAALRILACLSPADRLKAVQDVVKMNPDSRELTYLVQSIEYIVSSWPPNEQQGVDKVFFKELWDLLEYLFTCGAIYVYPTDDEAQTAPLERSPLQQLTVVQVVVHVYLHFIRCEIKGGTNLTGLLAPEALARAREYWLAPLLQEAREAVYNYHSFDREYVEGVLAYAVKVTQDPSLVARYGLFPEI